MTGFPSVRVAAIQATPVVLDARASAAAGPRSSSQPPEPLEGRGEPLDGG